MDITLRAVDADEFARWAEVTQIPFGELPSENTVETGRRTLPLDRTLAAFDGDQMIAAAGAFPFNLSVPGALMPAAGVTQVGVLPSHRRRGVLTKLMHHQLRDLHDRGESVAVLWASESAIYPRFGYGLASWHGSIDIERDRTSFVRDPGSIGRCRMVELADAAKVAPGIHEEVLRSRPGMFQRSADWWERRVLADSPEWRHGWGPKWCVVWEHDGVTGAYAIYRTKNSWDDGFPSGKVQVVEALATTVEGTREIWRYLFGLDLMSRIEGHFLPADHPLLHMLGQPDRLRFRLGPALWLRVIDVASALGARRYDRDGSFSFALSDDACPWNEGVWRVTVEGGRADVERTDDEADLLMTAVELGSVYLGGMRMLELGAAGRIEELRDGALDLADRIFRWTVAPWCPEIF